MKHSLKKLEVGIGKAAYNLTKANVNSACYWVIYQAKLPDAAKKLKEL